MSDDRPSGETLAEKYWDEGMSSPDIAEEYGVTGETIRRWMEEEDIPRRGPSEQVENSYDEELRQKRSEDAKEQFEDSEQREIRRQAQKGTELSEGAKESISEANSGSGISKYHEKALEHYGRECSHCGKTEEEEKEEVGRELSVHHKNGNKYDNRIENLAVLCSSCHTELHNKKRKEADYFTGEERISTAASRILNALGVDQSHPDYRNTPNRVARSYRETCQRCFEDDEAKIDEILGTTFPSDHENFVIVDDIQAYSLCPHHLKDIEYEVHFGYIPDEEVIGLSKIPRLVKYVAKKPMIQEQYTEVLANRFMEALDPKACIVVAKGEHACMSTRGIKANGKTITSASKGIAKETDVEDRFYTLLDL